MPINTYSHRSNNHDLRTTPVRRRHGRRAARLLALVALILTGALTAGVALAGPASADTLTYYSGNPGPSQISEPGVTCSWGSSQVMVTPPLMWARNFHAGAGNDGQWVRFRVQEFNEFTGAALAPSAYSSWSFAQDNAPAQWSGTLNMPMFKTWAGAIHVRIYMQWWLPGAASRFGDTTREVNKYYGVGYPGYYGGANYVSSDC